MSEVLDLAIQQCAALIGASLMHPDVCVSSLQRALVVCQRVAVKKATLEQSLGGSSGDME